MLIVSGMVNQRSERYVIQDAAAVRRGHLRPLYTGPILCFAIDSKSGICEQTRFPWQLYRTRYQRGSQRRNMFKRIYRYLISSANITPFFYSMFRYTQGLPDVVSPIVTARARYHNRDMLLEHQHSHNTGCHTGTNETQADTVGNFNTWLDEARTG